MVTDHRKNLITDRAEIDAICRAMHRVAVLGIKPEDHSDQPAHYVPRYMQKAGVEIVPVPVYYPDVTTILGQPVYRKVADVPGHIDCVDVFRRSRDLMPHLPDLILKKPDVVWLQLGIHDDDFAEQLAREGIRVIQDRCLMVEHRRALAAA